MKELFWKVLFHVYDPDKKYTDEGIQDWGENADQRSNNISNALDKVEAMNTLELLQTISEVFEKEANK